VFGVQRLMRFNVLGCFLVVASTSLVSGAAELLGQPDPYYRANGYAVVLALVLLVCLASGGVATAQHSVASLIPAKTACDLGFADWAVG